MHGEAVGQLQRVELLFLVGDQPVVVEAYGQEVLRRVDVLHIAHVAVEHARARFRAEGRAAGIFQLIVVFGLNHLVAHAKLRFAMQDGIQTLALGVERVL